jgi:hypothetical protein
MTRKGIKLNLRRVRITTINQAYLERRDQVRELRRDFVCLEEINFKQGRLSDARMSEFANSLSRNGYGDYLPGLVRAEP